MAYGTAERQTLLALEVGDGSTVADVLRAAGERKPFADLAVDAMPVGIFGRPVDRDTVVKPGDRVELYRPLAMDPKEARRRRAG